MKKDRDRLKRRLNAIPKEARKTIRRALEESAFEIADTAFKYAPERSGRLKKSIGYTFGKYEAENANVRGVSSGSGIADPDLSVTVHAGNAEAFYPAFVEFGTQEAAATPFFFPAYRTNKKKAVARIARATKKAAKDAAKTS